MHASPTFAQQEGRYSLFFLLSAVPVESGRRHPMYELHHTRRHSRSRHHTRRVLLAIVRRALLGNIPTASVHAAGVPILLIDILLHCTRRALLVRTTSYSAIYSSRLYTPPASHRVPTRRRRPTASLHAAGFLPPSSSSTSYLPLYSSRPTRTHRLLLGDILIASLHAAPPIATSRSAYAGDGRGGLCYRCTRRWMGRWTRGRI